MGMRNLLYVKDDRKNMKHTIKAMMNIPSENIFEVEDGTLEQLDKVQSNLRLLIQARTRKLIDHRMGILADDYGKNVEKGLDWNRVKE